MLNFFPKTATLRNKRKLSAMSKETQEYPLNNQSQKSSAIGIIEEFKTQISEKIEGKFTKELSREFNRTKSSILGTLSKLDEILLNPEIRTFSGNVPLQLQNADAEKQQPNAYRSQNDPQPKVEVSACRASNLTDSDPGEISKMVTGVQKEIPFSSFGTSSGKQKKARSTSQLQFLSENTPATIEADQILLALQQLANNSFAAIFNNNINRIWILTKSLTTPMLVFDGKSENLNNLKICFKQVRKTTSNSRKKTEYTPCTLSCVAMLCRLSKTSAAPA